MRTIIISGLIFAGCFHEVARRYAMAHLLAVD